MRRTHKAVALVAGTALVVGGATTAYALESNTPPRSAEVAVTTAAGSTADGRALFRGIFFGQGKVAKDLAASGDLFSEITTVYEQNNTGQALKAGHALLDAVAANDSGYFAEFSQVLRSGSPEQVETALLDAPKRLEDLGLKSEKAVGPDCLVTIAVAAAGVHVVGAITAAVVAVAEAAVVGANIVVGTNWFWSSGAGAGAGSSLSKDEAVAQVTQLLKA